MQQVKLVTLVYQAPGGAQPRQLQVYLSENNTLHLPSVRNAFGLHSLQLDGVLVPEDVPYSPAQYQPGARIEVSGSIQLAAGAASSSGLAGVGVGFAQDVMSKLKELQDQISGLKMSPRLSADAIKSIHNSMFLIFQDSTPSRLTAAALAALPSAVPSSSNNEMRYTADMFAGAGFFYEQPGLAVTPAHQLTQRQIAGRETVRIFMPSSHKELALKVVNVDKKLDFAYLRLEDVAPEPGAGADFLVAHVEPLSHETSQSVVLFSANIGQWLQLGVSLSNPQITQRKVTISLIADKMLTYTATTFRGDCGCPVIMTSSGKLVGMHMEMFNEYEESKKRKSDAERLSDLESSAKSSGPHEAMALQASAFPPVPAL